MHTFLPSTVIMLLPCIALAQSQCVLPTTQGSVAGMTTPPSVARSTRGGAQTIQPGGGSSRTPTLSVDAPALDHVVAAGATLIEAGNSHGLRTVIARNDGQFMRFYVSPDGQAVVAGLMAELSPVDLLTMAPGQGTELGTLHGLRGIFVRNAGQFQVFYASPDGERVIPGAMFDAQGKNLTYDQVAAIPGTVPTVAIGDAANHAAAQVQAPAGSLLRAVEATTYGTVGSPSAPRLWVLIDPLCAWSVRAMGQLRSYVNAGRVQLAVIPVAVLDHEDQGRSTIAARAMLSLSQEAMVAAWSDNKLGEQADPVADQRLSNNMAIVAAIGLRGTPTFIWRKPDGTEGRADGLPTDVDAFIASIGK